MLPLRGTRVVELEGLGPGPLAGLMLAGMGAEVTVIRRPESHETAERLGGRGDSPLRRGKREVVLDLKRPDGVAAGLELIAAADALIESFRPGVLERLGLGPEVCLARNPRLVYGRMTGWGQTGPLARAAGHDLNYVALTGILSLVARGGARPITPPTVLGDAAGALGLAWGVVCGILGARSTGKGGVVDAAIVDIVAMLGTLVHWIRAAGQIDAGVPSPFHDSPFYDTYECADGRYVTVAALEPRFYAILLEKLGFDDVSPEAQYDTARWPELKARFAARFRSRGRDEWCALLEGSDACFAPVLTLDEAAAHPHNAARGTYVVKDGALEARMAPRLEAR